MKIAIYPGSFDPVTKGHLNIIERAARSFDVLVVCVMVNGSKRPLFSTDERVSMLREVTAHIPNVRVDYSNKMLVEYAKEIHATVIVKGLRAVSDFEHEFQMALINHKINPKVDTMFLMAEHQFMYLSSSAVKELGRYNADLSDFLPESIIPLFKERMNQLGG